MGRVVVTHSTYIDGLLACLKELSKNKEIKTITPGAIYRSRGKSSNFKLRVTTRITGGFKLIARKGNAAQEVFVKTTLEQVSLEKIVDKSSK